MVRGGLFSVTLSVTLALRMAPSFSRGMPPFGVRTFLWRNIHPASDRLPLCHKYHRLPVGAKQRQKQKGRRQNEDSHETVKRCASFLVLFSRSFGESGLGEKFLARRGKTNIVHAPPFLAEDRSVLPERFF